MIDKDNLIIRGTTPLIGIETSASLVGATEIYVSLAQGNAVVERTKDTFEEVTDEYISLRLTQEETLAFDESGRAGAWQIRAIFPDTNAIACDEGSFFVGPIIKEGVI